ncbi:Eco57I restriction-modification methylase domain-containing protein [Pseudoxanthomonas kaohsiungensis]|uniref:site-specific DNA-methyltransferase (adenine-specific) n=1 Tax=Pseudoxanthomonas kaohsiungensis TaxID=283923 RepID=A0ABW3LRT9_9GAMM|nr:DNA methyltransferase [Pseudoxanthomonas kaohsiungensis]KAF1704223.1 restriction endonuclease subunit M [Pseudoxanthomonas kaohsiungensis]
MDPLERSLRNRLESTVKQARRLAEDGARAVLGELGVGEANPPAHLQEPQRALRRRLRAHGRQLGDQLNGGKVQTIARLVQEVAYQHWHRMLFARFLAENGLLMFDGVAVTLEECEELAPDEGARNGWELAGRLAERMLPQIFKSGSPVFELILPADVQIPLEKLLADLPPEVFTASDSLGWVYQFWQADNKDAINKSEVKIGADELPAVTQLFTEPYMVAFLLHNSLGAWWNTRHPDTPCPVSLDYLRTLEDGTPAAGTFDGWADSLAEFKLLDPCCGSGHFLVAAFLMLVPMRMAAEGLSAHDAVERVLAENLHGLELDARCVEIAVFALALEAWRYPDERGHALGVRPIPNPRIACCGLKVAAKVEDWQALVPEGAVNAGQLREGLARLHQQFAQAPLLGSLLSPSRQKGDLYSADYALLEPLLLTALKQEVGEDGEVRRESALSALGLLEAARLLEARYQLVITNVPYLARGKQDEVLRDYCERHYPAAKNDLANVFLERCLELCGDGGVVQIVMPQNWLFLTSYKKQRESLLKRVQWNLLARLGEGGFESSQAAGAFIILLTQTRTPAADEFLMCGVDASAPKVAQEKAVLLREGELVAVSQKAQAKNPDARVALNGEATGTLLNAISHSHHGLVCGDRPRMTVSFWELSAKNGTWIDYCGTVTDSKHFGGKETYLRWCNGTGAIRELRGATNLETHAWLRKGIVVSAMRALPVTLYTGMAFDNNTAVITADVKGHLPAIWCFCSSPEYNEAVRRIDQKLNVTNATLVKVPFDLERWQQVAAERYPNGLPKPYSDDPTQWIFHGHPCGSVVWDEEDAKWTAPGPQRIEASVLQIAVARLLGHRWPAETDADMELADEARALVAQSQTLLSHADTDGIVCIPPVGGEKAAADRLLNLLAAAYGESWNNSVLTQLLASADYAGKTLESWLRDKFFAQHCELFHQRPFIWHIWDGLRDGFAVLVNYHRLDTKTLEALIYTYLGNWISRQTQDAAAGVEGAQEKLDAAQALKQKLELILKGEQPYDIFVRWKPLDQQPIGWDPDLNDGVRLNIRPFLSVPDVGKKGAGVLRERPKLKWDKDRGKDVESAPWYHLGPQYGGKQGDRINDHHLSLAEKQKARERKK